MGGAKNGVRLEFEAAHQDFDQALTHFTKCTEQQRMAAENISRAVKRLHEARAALRVADAPPEEGPRTMTVPEAGTRLGLNSQSSYAAVRNGHIPVIRIGRTLRVPIVAFENMLRKAEA